MLHTGPVGSTGRRGIAVFLLIASMGLFGCGAGEKDGSESATATSDLVAPSIPLGLTGAAVSPSRINLSWTSSTDNVAVTGYRVYRGGELLVTLGNVTTYQNIGLIASTTYFYTVQAIDGATNASGQSATIIVTTPAAPDISAPSTPTGLAANAVSPSQIDLSWTASTDNVAVVNYRVFRSGALLTTLGNVTAFQDIGLTASTTYTYTVRALDAAGNISGSSAAAGATTLAPNTATLSWDAVTGASGYRVYYGTAPGIFFQPIGEGVNVGNLITHSVTGLGNSTRYYFAVTAYYASGVESSFSNEVFKEIP